MKYWDIKKYLSIDDIKYKMNMKDIDFEKILTEWSYRCEKGYPDINDPKDMKILYEILGEMNIDSLEEIDESKIIPEIVPNKVQINTENKFNWDDILKEWSYKLPNGYPTVVNGEFTDSDEVIILNEILQERGIELLEVARPITGTNDISLKEGLVCLFFDLFKSNKLFTIFKKLLEDSLNRKSIPDIKNIKAFTEKLSAIYKQNSKYYGVGKSTTQNLDKFVEYCLITKQELETVTNAASAAQTIHEEIVDKGRIIREQTFDSIRLLASKLIKEQYNINLQPDNWCPGDVYVVAKTGADSKALKSKNLNIGIDSLNSHFQKSDNLIAVSLKEQKAQAGKATTFADTVFTNTFKAEINPGDEYGTSDNKALAKLAGKMARFEEYFKGTGGFRRPQSYINAILKDGKLHNSINTILATGKFPTVRTSDIKMSNDEKVFYKLNKPLFDNLTAAVTKIKEKLSGKSSTKKVEKNFIESRQKFLSDLIQHNVEVSAEDNTKFAKAIQRENTDSISVLSKKQAAYELASLIIQKWTDPNAKISPAYKKIQAISNPFAALTAFAIAQAGVSPSFWKVIGNSKSITMGHAEFFDTKVKVDIDTKTSKIKLVDSVKQAGFYLAYTTTMGTKKYSTKLVFRFSGSEIRIEVQELKAI